MSDDLAPPSLETPPSETPRNPNRGFRPPPAEYAAAQAALPADQTMSDFLRACLRWIDDRPDQVGDVLAGYWPHGRRPGRPAGARDQRPRKLRGGGQWWAVWDGGEVRDLLAGPPGADETAAREFFGITNTGLRLEPCTDLRANVLHGWDEKSEDQKARLRPSWASTPPQ